MAENTHHPTPPHPMPWTDWRGLLLALGNPRSSLDQPPHPPRVFRAPWGSGGGGGGCTSISYELTTCPDHVSCLVPGAR